MLYNKTRLFWGIVIGGHLFAAQAFMKHGCCLTTVSWMLLTQVMYMRVVLLFVEVVAPANCAVIPNNSQTRGVRQLQLSCAAAEDGFW
jgi:hypothetical protein